MKTSQKVSSFLLLVFISFSLISLPILPSKIVQAQEEAVIETGWLDEFTYREHLGGELFKSRFHIAPQVFYDNETSSWQHLKVKDRTDHDSPHYLVQNAHISARIGISSEWDQAGVLYYTPDLKRKIAAEYWLVQAYISGSWQTLDTQFYSHTAFYNETFCNITGIFRVYRGSTQVGWLRTSYILKPSSYLKLEVAARNISPITSQFRLVLRLIGIAGTRVASALGETIVTLTEQQITANFIRFKSAFSDYTFLSQSLEDLGHYAENGSWVNDYLKGIRLQLVEYEGRSLVRCDIAIGDWTLASGQEMYVDPTVSTYYSDIGTDDGHIYGFSQNYNTARTVATGAFPTASTATVGQNRISSFFFVYRTYHKINTTSLPDQAIIQSANFNIYVSLDKSDTNFFYTLQKWTGDTPITTADFNQFDGTNYGFASTSAGTGWNDIVLSNLNLITKQGYTMICLRSSRDISATAPTGEEYMVYHPLEGANDPYLEVTYATYFPQYSNMAVSTHQANTEAKFVCNWTADKETPPTTDMSHYIFGWNETGTFQNETAKGFDNTTETLISSWENASSTWDVRINTPHPAVIFFLVSSRGQAVTINITDADYPSYNISSFQVRLRKYGSPDCKIMASIYVMGGSMPQSRKPTENWSSTENSTNYVEATDLTTSFIWYEFNFSGIIPVNDGNTTFGISIVPYDVITLTGSERIHVNDDFDTVSNENQFYYIDQGASSNWITISYELIYRLYGVPSAIGTWSNVTKNLPVTVGTTIQWQFWANNTYDWWNTTGLQTFTTVGINFTFYYSPDGFFTFSTISRLEGTITVVNGSSYGVANGTDMILLGSPKNSSYYWLNFTWDGGGSTENYANLSVVFAMEGYDFWCIFASTPVGDGDYIIARFHWNITLPDILEPMLFDGSASESSSTITIYEWDYGDGNNATGVTAVHDYTAYGNYTVVLNVTSAAGSNSTYQYLTIGSTPAWAVEMNTLPNWEIVILTITSIFFSILFFGFKIPLWGIISFGSWLIEGLVWIFINPVSYYVSLLFFGIATVILILTLILQLEAVKLRDRGLGEERMAPV